MCVALALYSAEDRRGQRDVMIRPIRKGFIAKRVLAVICLTSYAASWSQDCGHSMPQEIR